MKVHFISDLHLSEEEPATVRAFIEYLSGTAQSADVLYILGDLFEYWAGDDDHSALSQQVAEALRTLAESGSAIRFMAGNRDFLLGQQYAQMAGMTLLPDPTRIVIDGIQILLTHGDQFCTDDKAYVAYRQQVRAAQWQQGFLSKPLSERKHFIESLRARSQLENASKTPEIMDVNEEAVARAFRTHDCRVIIHGHTHRPRRHDYVIDGKPCVRWVLADWDAEAAHYLEWRAGEATPRKMV